jgi:subtilisin-like proprotein convertase family protein
MLVEDHLLVRTYDPVGINNAPLQARIDTVHVAFTINHSYPADLWVQLRSPQNIVEVIYTYGNCPGGYISFATTYFNGGTVNGTWTLEVYDGYPFDTGNISYFEVGVDWKFP